MGNILKIEVTAENEGKKLFAFMKHGHDISTRTSRKLLMLGNVSVNGKVAKANQILKAADVVEIDLEKEESQDIEPENIPIEIVYEDEDILVVNKGPFMVVHPTKGHPTGTLANAAMNYFRTTDQNCIIRLVNRLDRDTSGLVMIAKTQFAHQAMAKRMQANKIEKSYMAVVEGEMTGKATIDLPIDRPYEDSVKRAVVENGYRAVTHYEVIKSSKEMSLLLIRLETGRTHQIRVHMSHIGHPIVGDTLYGSESELINRQALHAYKLAFCGIRNDEILEVTADLPQDMQKLKEIIEKA